MITDPVLTSFLERQLEEGTDLAANSDILELLPLGPGPIQRYLARFNCRGVVHAGGKVTEANRFDLGIQFPSDYLRRAEPMEVLTFLGPPATFHPNIRFPLICPGRLTPGTSLVDILYQCFEILTYFRVTMREDDCLNPAACPWARSNQDRFPLESRPLRRPGSAAPTGGAGESAGAGPADASAEGRVAP